MYPRQLARTGRFSFGAPRAFTVAPDGRRVVFLRTRAGDDPVSCLWCWDADGGERLLADPVELGAGGGGAEGVPPEEAARRERARERTSGITGYATDAAVGVVAFALAGRLWTVPADGGGVPREVPVAGHVTDPRPDPTGARIAYVSGGALRVTEIDGTGDRALAEPEGPDVRYGLAEHVAAESMGRMRGYWWAPDGGGLLVARVDESGVGRWWIGDPSDPARPPRAVRYPAAGTANAEVTAWVLGVDGTRTEVVWDRAGFEYLTDAAWDGHGIRLAVQSRDQRTLRVLAADPADGTTRTVDERRDAAWVELVPGALTRTASGTPVHVVEDEETRRLRIGAEALTPPGLQVRAVLGADGERVFFTASDEPTETHVWSHHPAEGFTRVSREPGVHSATAAGGTLVLDSRTESGDSVTVWRDGAVAGRIASSAEEPLIRPRPVRFHCGERAIRTALYLPSWYEPSRGALPVLLTPYGGPGMQVVRRDGAWDAGLAQWFAEAGFAVVVADGRGTPGRGPAWEKWSHGDKVGAALEDQVAALHAVARERPELDLSRVAIRGWSYGGHLAAAAVLRRPDVFHAAVAGAAPFDQRWYDTHWQERFLGHPDEHPEAYDRSSLIAEAPALRRPLLMIHGVLDDNVAVAHTLRMSAALLAAGRPHSVLPLPGATHRVTDAAQSVRLHRYELDFLRRALASPVV
ncbi:peptidase S9 prolyl oligopeptidase active site domain protein [Streptantibioticus cattleyicolor NRRL 8057 = DSM 46488]|uniref:Peptidase S9 prolyl oligopeptidase active site domain protein n=1 Tax=Streptantibioticus cattleyicolor (strain ATCC 35852 / DSM 46488 / JCM 4925 / NBRC 14057 / NRRL 8057) TaxID=1003195 RepID=G8WVX2_STREN|nr:peptidase S9 prolyl oligopeptidase active site domain protein [Streptantibioticus cattleyicolor NRRL 8057 = DSM 46488]